MPIAALQQATINTIGSTSALSDPCSAVKELIENALDSGATSISIEISSNTVDTIQVKDNGSGIPPEDRKLACKWNYTSKIQTLEDLRHIGGKSFGFRGQALASIAEASGSLSITTRVGEEEVASEMNFDRSGEILSMQRTFHPRGTTVRVRNFLKILPVRRQRALKNGSKQIADIKKLLYAYALSRLNIRFSFRVLKLKHGVDWVYSPSTPPSTNDAILKVVGAAVVANCTEISLSSSESAEDMHDLGSSMGPGQTSNKLYRGCIRLSAVLPKQDADLTKLNHKGQYVFIDGRPMRTTRGIGKAIVKVLKQRLQCLSTSQAAINFVDPFLCISLSCPAGVYDVNVEPGKDDVQFEDHQYILCLVEILSKRAYGEVSTTGEDGQANTAAIDKPYSWPVNTDDDTSFQTKPPDLFTAKSLVLSQEPSAISPLNFHSKTPCTPPLEHRRLAPKKPRVTQTPGRTLGGDKRGTICHPPHHPTAANPWEMAKLSGKRSYPRDPHSQLLTPRREAGDSILDCIASSQEKAFDEMTVSIMHSSQASPAPYQSIESAAVRRGFRGRGEPSDIGSESHPRPRLPKGTNMRESTIISTDSDDFAGSESLMQAIEDRFGAPPGAYPVPISTGAVPASSPPQFNILELSGCPQTNLDRSIPRGDSSTSPGHLAERKQRCRQAGVGNQIDGQADIRLGQLHQPRASRNNKSFAGSDISYGHQTPSTETCKNGNNAIVSSNQPQIAASLGSEFDDTASGSLDLRSTLTHGFRRKNDTKSGFVGRIWPKISQHPFSRLPVDAVVSSQTCQLSVIVRAATGEFTSSVRQLTKIDSYVKSGELIPTPFFQSAEARMIESMKSKALQLTAGKYGSSPSIFTETQQV